VVTVFGGTGFLGRRIVNGSLAKGFAVRVASRHPKRAGRDPTTGGRAAEAIQADILDASSVAAGVEGSHAVVNAVSLYVEHREQTFERVHVAAAAELARMSRDAGVWSFVQFSGIGSNSQSDSNYVRARGRVEVAVKTVFSGAFIVRPAVMTGPDDAFLTTIVRLIRLLPIYPLFGDGGTRLQPVYVEDVAEAVSRVIAGPLGLNAQFLQARHAGRCYIVVTHEVDLVARNRSGGKKLRNASQGAPRRERHRHHPDPYMELLGYLPKQILVGVDARAAKLVCVGATRNLINAAMTTTRLSK
jgi:uncharacterized protein YbjT (DUF2867 family)